MNPQSATIRIERPAREVFEYMDDVSREHEWQPNLVSADQDPPAPTRVGTQKRYVSRFMGREVRNTYVVRELEPGRRVVYQTTPDSSVEATSEIVCEPDGDATHVTMHVEAKPKGAMRLIPRAALEAVSREELEKTLGRLKEQLER